MFTTHEIVRFLKSSQAQNFILPLVIAFIAGFVKTQSRRPSQHRFNRQDLAVGLDLTITAIFGFAACALSITELSPGISQQDQGEQLAYIGYAEVFFIFALWLTSVLVSNYGWEEQKEELNWLGIGLPLVLAGVAFRELAHFIFV
jgi:hypothetical protein